MRESTGTDKEAEARRILRERLGDLAAGRPDVPHADRVRFEELAEDFLNDYRINGRKSLDRAEQSVNHLRACFAGWKVVNISTPANRPYFDRRWKDGSGNGTINRALAPLKCMPSLALEAEQVLRRAQLWAQKRKARRQAPRKSLKEWWAGAELNCRHQDFQSARVG